MSSNKSSSILNVTNLFEEFVPYRKLELLAFEGLVPWISICVSTGVQSIYKCCMLYTVYYISINDKEYM